MKRTLFAMAAALALLGSSVGEPRMIDDKASDCPACDQQTWSYSGMTGPEFWWNLCAPVCSDGNRQSPIAIAGAAYWANLTEIIYHRGTDTPELKLKNYGFTPKISYVGGPGPTTYIQFTGQPVQYQFNELHFHIPSEHTLNGRRYAMEMHMVHKSAQNGAVAIAVLIKEGAHNDGFDNILDALPAGRCHETLVPYQNVYDLLPTDRRDYYYYEGSLTTPDCDQTVQFVVLSRDIELSRQQMEKFRAYLHSQGFVTTNRPLQDPHGRRVATNIR